MAMAEPGPVRVGDPQPNSSPPPPRRVVILGAESTGTTTLARALAAARATVCVPEFGRHFWEARQFLPDQRNTWTGADFLHIQTEQNRLEDDLAALAGRAGRAEVVCDTDCVATTVWQRFYLGTPGVGAGDDGRLDAGVSSRARALADDDAAAGVEEDAAASAAAAVGARGAAPAALIHADAACRALAQAFLAGAAAAATGTAGGRRAKRMYIVTDPGIPYEQDGTREGEHMRQTMHQWFQDELTWLGLEFHVASGTVAERVTFVEKLLDGQATVLSSGGDVKGGGGAGGVVGSGGDDGGCSH